MEDKPLVGGECSANARSEEGPHHKRTISAFTRCLRFCTCGLAGQPSTLEVVQDIIASVMSAANEDDRVAALTQLALLPRAQQQILATGGAPLLVSLLSDAESMATREVVAALIRNLAIAQIAHRPLLEAGALQGLTEAMREGSAECRGYAQDALLSLMIERGICHTRGWAGTTRTHQVVRIRPHLSSMPGVGGASTIYRALVALQDHGSGMLRRTFQASLRHFHQGGKLDVSRVVSPVADDAVPPGEECPICLTRMRGGAHASGGDKGRHAHRAGELAQAGHACAAPAVDPAAPGGGGQDGARGERLDGPHAPSLAVADHATGRMVTGERDACPATSSCRCTAGAGAQLVSDTGRAGVRSSPQGDGNDPGMTGGACAGDGDGIIAGSVSADDSGPLLGGDGSQERQDPLQVVMLKPCHHKMHRSCAEMWLVVSPCCPLCRQLLVE